MYTFEVVDLTSNNSFRFDTATAFILGRGDKFGIQDRTVSRKQGKIYHNYSMVNPPRLCNSLTRSFGITAVQLEALGDGRCFAERVSWTPLDKEYRPRD